MQRTWPVVVCMVLGVASCGQPPPPTAVPRAPAPVTVAPAAPTAFRAWPAPVANPDAVTGLAWMGERKLVFVDGGAGLLAIDDYPCTLTLIDPATRTIADSLRVCSPSVPDHSHGSSDDKREQHFAGHWRWDAARRTIVGAGYLSGSGDVALGLSVWAPARQAIPTRLDPHVESVALALADDTARVLARTGPSTVQVLTVATAAPAGPPITVAHPPLIGTLAGGWIATASVDGDVDVYDLAAGQAAALPRGRNTRISALVIDPVRPVLVVCGDHDVTAWDLRTRTPARLADGGVAAAFTADGALLVVASDDAVALRDGATLRPIRSIAIPGVETIALAADGARLAVQTKDALSIHVLHPPGAAAFDRGWFDQLRPLPVPAPAVEPAIARGGVITGRVTAAGRPVAGAEVRLEPSEQESPHARALPPIVQRTSAAGTYRFTGVPRITWSVLVRAPGMRINGGGAELRKAPAATIDAVLEPGATIHGRVLGPDGRPAAGVHVRHGRWPTMFTPVDLTTGPDGTFTIDHLVAGQDSYYGRPGYEVQAWRADGAAAIAHPELKSGPIALTLKLRAPGDPRLAQLVIVDEHGAPVPGVEVELDDTRHASDARGRFSADIEPDQARSSPDELVISVDGARLAHAFAWPAHGVVTVEVDRGPPPGTLLPLDCIHYRAAIERLAHCDRVPQATRDALRSEFDRAAATWAAHPERAGFECGMSAQVARDTARLCH